LVKPVRRAELRAAIGQVLSEASAPGAAGAPTAGTEPAPVGARILLVEDTPENQLLVRAYVGGTPHHLRVVERGDDAFRAYTESPSECDLIFMDIQMQGIDGYEATRRIRSWEAAQGAPRIPIVALTAHALDEERRKSLEAGCDAHLTKPIRKDVFLAAIASHARSPDRRDP
jgi:CheY-like chemotaxis protein